MEGISLAKYCLIPSSWIISKNSPYSLISLQNRGGGGGSKISQKDDGCRKVFFVASPVSLIADGTALDGASAVRIRRPEAVRGSNQDTFIERDTASSEAQI